MMTSSHVIVCENKIIMGYLSECNVPALKGDRNEDLIELVIEQQKSLVMCNNKIRNFINMYSEKGSTWNLHGITNAES